MSEHTGGLSEAEREAVRQRAAELREQNRPAKGAAKRKREAEACDKAIAELEGTDHRIASRLHDIVARVAPHLDPKTWYGFPSYAHEGNVVVFFQPSSKFDTRYATVGFTEHAALDEGVLWPTSFAVIDMNAQVEELLSNMVSRAAPEPSPEVSP